MITSSRRTLVQALTVSLLLHVVLLSCAVSLVPARLEVPATTISALIRDAAPALSASPVRSPGEAAKPSSPHATSAQQATPPSLAEPAEVHVAPQENSPPALPGAIGRSSALSASGSVVSPGVLPGALTGSAPTGGQGISGDDLRQYRLSLASAARRFRQYPALARQRGWEGTVEVALTVSVHAAVPDVALVRSSGRGVLDEQALYMLAQAARVTALPEGLKARDFRLVLPVQFSLENDQ